MDIFKDFCVFCPKLKVVRPFSNYVSLAIQKPRRSYSSDSRRIHCYQRF